MARVRAASKGTNQEPSNLRVRTLPRPIRSPDPRPIRPTNRLLRLWHWPAIPHVRNQVADFERFYQEGNLFLFEKAAGLGFREAGKGKQEVSRKLRPAFDNPAAGFLDATRSSRHFAVHNQGVKLLPVQNGFHLVDAGHRGDLSPRPGEDVALEFEHALFVFHQQNPAIQRTQSSRRRFRGNLRAQHTSRGVQLNLNDGTAALGIASGNLSAMLLHDAITDAKPQA